MHIFKIKIEELVKAMKVTEMMNLADWILLNGKK